MELKVGGKDLAAGALVGLVACFYIIYLGTANPGRYFYEGAYNTHDPHFVNKNPLAHAKIGYGNSCADCHFVPWQAVDNKTCNTSGCHNSIDETKQGREGVKFNNAAFQYHNMAAVKQMDCSACHRVHEFREVEAKHYYGSHFNHALMIPEWEKNHGCAACHEPFEQIGLVAEVLRTVPEFRAKSFAELEAVSARWLSESARHRLEFGDAASGGSTLADQAPEFRPYNPDRLAEAMRAGGSSLIYFRNQASLQPGGACRYLEDEALRLAPVAEAAKAYAKLFVADWEQKPEAWRQFKMFRAGSFAVVAPGGEVKRLHFFHSPGELLAFLRANNGAASAPQPADAPPANAPPEDAP